MAATKAQFVLVYRAPGARSAKFKLAAYNQKKCIQEGVHRSYKAAVVAARNMLRPSRKRKRKKK